MLPPNQNYSNLVLIVEEMLVKVSQFQEHGKNQNSTFLQPLLTKQPLLHGVHVLSDCFQAHTDLCVIGN